MILNHKVYGRGDGGNNRRKESGDHMRFALKLSEGIIMNGLDQMFTQDNIFPFLDQMEQHWRLVKETNQKFNLTAIKDDEEALERHYLDCLFTLPWVPEDAHLIDIGSGAGFPGIPLAICRPQAQVILLEATEKKAHFLEQCCQQLGLQNVQVVCGRAEQLGHDPQYREQLTLAVARAVASMPVLLEYALPLLKKEGYLLAMKGPNLDEEWPKESRALKELGGIRGQDFLFTLPFSGQKRRIVLAVKDQPTPEKYPRREGVPEKNPL